MFCFEWRSCFLALVDLEFFILISSAPTCWDYRHALPHQLQHLMTHVPSLFPGNSHNLWNQEFFHVLRIVYFLIFKCSKCTCMTTKNLKDQFQWHGHYKHSVFKARGKGENRAALQYCVSFSSFASLAYKSNFKICIEFTQNCDHCWLLSLLSLLLTYRTLLCFFFTIRKSKDPININH